MHKSFINRASGVLTALALLGVGRPEPAHASPISYDFTGTVNTSNISGVNPGDPFSGTVTYDTSVPVSSSAINTSQTTEYDAPEPSNLIGLEVKVGSQTFGFANPGSASVTVSNNLVLAGNNAPPADLFRVGVADIASSTLAMTNGGSGVQQSLNFTLNDPSGQAFTSTALPTSLGLSQFAGASVIFSKIPFVDDLATPFPDWAGEITTLTPAVVPEPSTLALMGLAIVGYALHRRTRGGLLRARARRCVAPRHGARAAVTVACLMALLASKAPAADSKAYITRGNALREQREYDKAIAEYTEALRLDPRDVRLHAARGIAWCDKGHFANAIADYTEAIRLEPQYVSAYVLRGSAWCETHEFAKAIADYTEAIERDPQRAETYAARGDAWLGKNEKDRAIADYTEAIRLDPNSAPFYRDRGAVWRSKGKYESAIADFTEAIRLDPEKPQLYCERGRAWLANGDRSGASFDFKEAIRLQPHPADARTYTERADACLLRGDRDAAIADCNAAIALDPGYTEAYFIRGVAWETKRQYDRAGADYVEAVRLGSKSATIRLESPFRPLVRQAVMLACARSSEWKSKGDLDQAIATADDALRLDPASYPAYLCRAIAWEEKGDPDKAIADSDAAIRLGPAKGAPFSLRAGSWDAKGDSEKALADFNEAIRLEPENANAYTARAFHWSRTGEFDKAIADFNEAIRLNPKSFTAYTCRAWIWATCRPPISRRQAGRRVGHPRLRAERLERRPLAPHAGRRLRRGRRLRGRSEVAGAGAGTRAGREGPGRRSGPVGTVPGEEAVPAADGSEVNGLSHRSLGTSNKEDRMMRQLVKVVAVIVLIPGVGQALAQQPEGRVEQEVTTRFGTARTTSHTLPPAPPQSSEAIELIGAFEAAVGVDLGAIRLDRNQPSAEKPKHDDNARPVKVDKALADLTRESRLNAEEVLSGESRSAKAKRGRDQALAELTAAIRVPGPPAPREEGGHFAARVGDEFITREELTAAVKEQVAKLPGGATLNLDETKALTCQVLDMLVERTTIVQEAKRELKNPENLEQIFAIADNAWNEEELPPLLRTFGLRMVSELKEKLIDQGRSLDAIRASYRQDFLARGYLEYKLKDKGKVTDSELRDHYNAHLDEFNQPEQWSWREELIEARRPADPAPFAEVEDKVRSIVQRQKLERASNALLETLRSRTVVTIFDSPVAAESEL